MLDESSAGDDPLAFFGKWFAEAEAAKADEVNAMTLATADAQNRPHARIVLLKGLDEEGFIFFTNYNSAKGLQINENPNVALVFFWKELERQVRIEGKIEKVRPEISDQYFQSRPDDSKLGAWSSPQSQVITSRKAIEDSFLSYQQKFTSSIPRPDHWGGYRVVPHMIEFWQGRSNRMHDRIIFSREVGNGWLKQRLAP